MERNRVGGDVDAYCTRCRMILGHTVLAMVETKIARVRCNTCQGEHAFKPSAGGSAAKRVGGAGRTSPAPARPAREKVVEHTFDELLATRDTSQARPYAARARFTKDELVHHPSFGVGVVEASRGDKMDVRFRAGVKTLVQGLGEKSAAAPHRPLVTGEEPPSSASTDKPPPGASGALHVVHDTSPTPLPTTPGGAGDV